MKNTKTIVFVIALFLMSAMVAACAGFDIGDVIQTKTPSRISQTEGTPSKLSLNEAEQEYKLWLGKVQSQGTQWKNNIDKSNQFKNVLSQLSMQALDSVGPAIAGIPMLGPAIPLVAGLIGLTLRRPGDISKAALAKEKQDSFNKGQEMANKLVKQAST